MRQLKVNKGTSGFTYNIKQDLLMVDLVCRPNKNSERKGYNEISNNEI